MAKKDQISEKPKARVAICMPLFGEFVKAKTMFSLMNAVRGVDFEWEMFLRIGCDLIGGREGLVRQAKEWGATHLLFVDYDMMFMPIKEGDKFISPITKMLEKDKDVLAAEYHFRRFPLQSTVTPLSEFSDKQFPYKASAAGTGLMLINMRVFDGIPKPYFNFGRNDKAELVYGEDTWFCQQAIKAGFEVWADPTIPVQHMGEYAY